MKPSECRIFAEWERKSETDTPVSMAHATGQTGAEATSMDEWKVDT